MFFFIVSITVLDRNNQRKEALILVPGFRRVSPWLLGCMQTWAGMTVRGCCSGYTPHAGRWLGVGFAGDREEGRRTGSERGYPESSGSPPS